jgi:cytochrome c biogenesis protein CcmG, thiol:disulfide interchange protein DsbE
MTGRVSMRYIVIAAAAIVLLLELYRFYVAYHPLPPEATFEDEFALTLKNYDGADVRLSEFEDSVLVVYLFASWCPYCGDEMRTLARLKDHYAEQITVLAVNRAEPLVDAKGFTDALNVSGIQYLLDPEDALYKKIGGYAMPETVFITDRGEVLYHQRGPIQVAELEEKLRELVQ